MTKIFTCKHCKKEFSNVGQPKGFMGNHSRWCVLNPDRQRGNNTNINSILAMNEARKKTGRTNQYTVAEIDGKEKPQGPQTGKISFFWGIKHTEETKEKMRHSALNSKHRRLTRNIIEYKGIKLDSSWEYELAVRLDTLGIKWIRPKPIPWIDKDGLTHNYFPDFYLPDFDLYIDPKNKHVYDTQKEKIDILMETYDNILILTSLEECRNFSIE